MRPRKLYKFYLLNPASSSFYVDQNGMLQTTSTPTCLRNSPAGWMDTEISFDRSDHYWGLARSYTTPLKFVGDGAAIIRNLFYKYRGIEQLLQVVVLKWDPATDAYLLFYKGLLDLKTAEDTIEGFSVNTMEGGAVQMLKTYEKTMFEFPCDGSLGQTMPDGSVIKNVKANLDGTLSQDDFHYTIPNFVTSTNGLLSTMPANFISNDGDSFGVTRGNPNYVGNAIDYTSPNYLFSSVAPISITIRGFITLKPLGALSTFNLFTRSSEWTSAFPNLHEYILIPDTNITGPVTLNFNTTIQLDANENLFLLFFIEGILLSNTQILGGSFEILFNSKPLAASVWGIPLPDLWKLLVFNACALASSTVQTYNFAAVSDFLEQYRYIIVTSGDAIRASGDPNYLKYFNRIQTNPQNPTFQFFNFYNSFGPVVKTCIADFFDAINPILCCSLGNEIRPGDSMESLFIEDKGYVLDPSEITMTLPEVTDFKISTAEDMFWNVLKIGYQPAQYDEKAGKFEPNTTFQWASSVKTVQKILELISKYRTDAYGVLYTQANLTQDAKSTTYNSSDNSVFLLSTDSTTTSFDSDLASFVAVPFGAGEPLNGNQKPQPGISEQGVSFPTVRGTYLLPNNDPSIFIFRNPAGLPGVVTFTYNGVINGLPGDTVTLQFYYNGVVVATRTYALTTANTPFSDVVTLTEAFALSDCLYVKAITTDTCDATINNFQMQVGSSYFTASLGAAQEVQPGNPGQLVVMTFQTGPTVVVGGVTFYNMAFGLPLLLFNEYLNSPNFTFAFLAQGISSGAIGQSFTIKLWLNGVVIGSQTIGGAGGSIGTFANWTTNPIAFPSVTRDMAFGDVIWATISTTGGMTAEIGNLLVGPTTPATVGCSLTMDSNQIQIADLLRKQYDAISGVPALLGNTLAGAPITTGAGAPFNLEPFTPGRMLRQNAPLLASTLFNLVPDEVAFLTSDKNQYLSTTLDGETITENAPVPVHALGDPFFYPIYFEFKTAVKIDISKLQSYVANGHIAIPYLGKTFYGFPWKITQKPSLDDSQTWKVLCSPRTNLADLVDLNYDGLGPTLASLMPGKLSFSKVAPLQMVPFNQTQSTQYNFVHMDADWFINQVKFWVSKRNYFQKWQIADPFAVQTISNGDTAVNLLIYDCNAVLKATVPLNQPAGSPLQPPFIQLEDILNFTTLGLPAGLYYIAAQGSMGTACISEGINVQPVWPVTLLFEYSNSVNKQSTVFSTGFKSAFRVEGWIDQFSPESKFTTFEDQPADIELLNAIPYEKYKLNIGTADGVPPWVIRKVDRILLLDTVMIDGMPFTRDADAKWEVKRKEGWPKAYWSIDIRPAFNDDAVTFGEDGSLDSGIVVIGSVDLSAFGNNPMAAPQITQFTES